MNKIKDILKEIARATLISLLMFGVIASATTLNFVQTPTSTLYSSISTTATSMRITPYPRDLDNVKLTITDFGSSPTLTVDPKVKLIEEIIGFTGITDNGDNTATLTGLSRDLTSKSPYTTTGTGRQHGAGAIVVFSNNPQMYARLAAPENAATITGLWTYTTSPIVPIPTTAYQAVPKTYVDSAVISGGVISQEGTLGVVRLATQLQTASSSFDGSLPTVLYSKYSTSTPTAACGLCIPTTLNNGKLSQSFFDLTQNYNWTGNHIFTGNIIASSTSNNYIGSSTIPNLTVGNINATSTMRVAGANVLTTASASITGAISTSSTFSLGTADNSTATRIVYCVSPKVVASGGYSGLPSSSDDNKFYTVTNNYPDSTSSWTVSVICKMTSGGGTCAGGTVTAYAICVNP